MAKKITDPANTIGYFRVSTPRQATDGHAMERYHDQLLRWGIPEDNIYWDIESGGSDKRKGFNAVLQRCREGAKYVAVPCFDRFQRSSLIWEQVRLEFVQLGVSFLELDGGGNPMDLETPSGILNGQMRAIFAEFQKNQNRHASLQGHKFRRSQKKPLLACFGYYR